MAVSLLGVQDDSNIKTALVNLLYEELDDPRTYKIFKEYFSASINLHDLFHQSNSLRELIVMNMWIS